MEPLRIGFIGTTSPHSFMFLETLRLMPETVGRIALVETDPARIERSGCEYVYNSYEDMLYAERPELCFVMVRADEAEDPALRCAENSVPFVLDKHCARSAESLRRILDACEMHQVKMATGYMWRYTPIARQLRAWVAAGMFGRPFCFDARMVTTSPEARLADEQFAWLFEREKSGGGVLLWLGCHYIDIARFILQKEVAAVSAVTSRLTSADSDVEDVASVSLQFEDGIVGTLHCAYVMPKGFRDNYDTAFALWGSDGDAAWSPVIGLNPTLRIRSLHGEMARCPERTIHYQDVAEPRAYCGMQLAVHWLRDLVTELAAGRDFLATGRDALKVLEICEAAYQSAQTGQRVELAR